MNLFREQIYPYLVDVLGDPSPIRAIRQELIPLAHGNVLEIGAGSGANFIHYDRDRVRKLYALEPNPGMVKLAKRRLRPINLQVEFLELSGEHIPLKDETVDVVVSTFTLCTISAIEDAIRETRRVLKYDGTLIFVELGLAPNPAVQRWQKRLEPFCQWLFQGLSLTRDIPSLIGKGGYQINQKEQAYLARFPKSLSYCCWGTAIMQGR